MAFVDISSEIMILPALSRAVFEADNTVYTLSSSTNEPEPYYFEEYSNCSPTDFLGFEVSRETSEETVRVIVKQEKDRNDFVFFFLASLDRSLDFRLREGAASLVDTLLADNELNTFAHDILLSEPFRSTREASLESAFPSLQKYTSLVCEAILHQAAAEHFWRAWGVLAQDTNALSLTFDLDLLRDSLLRLGVVARFVRSIQAADSQRFNNDLIGMSLIPEIREHFGTAPQLLTKLRNILNRQNAFNNQQLSLDIQIPAEQQESEDSDLDKRWHVLFGHEAYIQISTQIENIKTLLLSGSPRLVDKAVRELVAFQREHSAPEYLAKTLCNLSHIAMEANEMHIAKQLSDEAVAIGVHDIIVDSTAAEVMKNLGNFAEARKRYESALLKYGEERYLINGLADVLKESGEFEAALAIYERTERAFPDDPVARNGISTVYFAMGRPQAALTKSQANVIMFGDVVSRVICGNILRHLGRNHESLKLMEETSRLFPKEMTVWNGYIRSLSLVGRHQEALETCEQLIQMAPHMPLPRLLHGDLLRKTGRLSESLASFNKSLVRFPSHRGLHLGKASVLLLLGETAEAAKLAEIENPESELDWRMFHIFASSFIRKEQYEAALSSLEWGLANVPWRKLRSLFSDTIGYVKLRMGNARDAITEFRKGLKTADKAKRNGLYLLLGRAYSEIGNFSASARYLAEVTSTDPPVMELKATVKPGIQLLRDSSSDSSGIEQNEFQMLLAVA